MDDALVKQAVTAYYDQPPWAVRVGFAFREAQRLAPSIDMELDIAMPAAHDHQSR